MHWCAVARFDSAAFTIGQMPVTEAHRQPRMVRHIGWHGRTLSLRSVVPEHHRAGAHKRQGRNSMGKTRLRVVRGRKPGISYGRWAVIATGRWIQPSGWLFMGDFDSWQEAMVYADQLRQGSGRVSVLA